MELAASSTVPILFIGVCLATSSSSCSVVFSAPINDMGVSTTPGARQFTRIFFEATSLAADFVRPTIFN